MDVIDGIISFLGKTQNRDKALRLLQYATLHSVSNPTNSATFRVYSQMRITRKILRFLRTLQYSSKIRHDVKKLPSDWPDFQIILCRLFGIFQNLFTFLFYLSDHRVCLSQLKVIDKSYRVNHYPKSMRFYMFQNIFGVLRNFMEVSGLIFQGKNCEQIMKSDKTLKVIKGKIFDLIRCLLDILVALYYLKDQLPAQRIGIIGVVTSIMGIMQSLHLI